MKQFQIPQNSQVTAENAKTLDSLKNALGFTPNIYAFMANSPYGLNGFLAFNRIRSTFSKQELEVINLTVSQFRECVYCLSAHTQISKSEGFSEDQILKIRQGKIDFDTKLSVLSEVAKTVVKNHGKISNELIDKFYEVGYTDAHLVDLTLAMAAISVTNWINNITNIPVDFPMAAAL